MRILGIDYGLKKIGLAISEGELAEPLGVIRITNYELRIANICEKEKIDKIVIGVSEGNMVTKQRRFGAKLVKITSLPVEFQDETLTSQDAIAKMNQAGKRRKFRRQFQDAVAAAIILQSWLDKN